MLVGSVRFDFSPGISWRLSTTLGTPLAGSRSDCRSAGRETWCRWTCAGVSHVSSYAPTVSAVPVMLSPLVQSSSRLHVHHLASSMRSTRGSASMNSLSLIPKAWCSCLLSGTRWPEEVVEEFWEYVSRLW